MWMPGFMQFITGVYLFVGLAWLHSFRETPLYAAALAFTAYGVHWFAIGMNRARGADPRPNGFVAIAFTLIFILGVIVFVHAKDFPVGGLFLGLTAIYISDFFASLELGGGLGERALGFFHLGTGLWLMHLTFATTLNLSQGFALPR